MRTPIGWVERVVGLFIAVVLAVLITALFLSARKENFFRLEDPFEVYTFVEKGYGLRNGATVLIRDVEAGVVTDVKLVHQTADATGRVHAGGTVQVTMHIFGDFPEFLTTRTRARVLRPPIGSTSIELVDDGKGGDPLEKKAHIEQLEEAPESLDEKIAKIKDDVKQVKDELVATLRGAQGTISDVNSMTHAIVDQKGTLGRLIFDEKMGDDVKATVAATRASMEDLKKSAADLPKATEDARALVKKLDQTLPSATEDARALVKDVRESMKKVDAALEPLPRILERVERAMIDTEAILANLREASSNVPETVRKSERAFDETNRTLEAAQRSFLLRGNVPEKPRPRTEAEALPR